MRLNLLLYFLATLFLIFAISGCGEDSQQEDPFDTSLTRIHTDRTYFKDDKGRYLFMHGVNVSGSTKIPTTTDPISYVGKPFKLNQAEQHFKKLRKLGFNTLRLLTVWEAIEPYASGVYDEEYLDYFEQIVSLANQHGIYVIIDMHQDLFSRHLMRLYDDQTGKNSLVDKKERQMGLKYGLNNKIQGDGAPLWAVQLCLPEKDVGGPQWGLPSEYVPNWKNTPVFYDFTFWALNMFVSVDVDRCFATFFAGRQIYPNYFVDGKNIQDYLQDSYANAWRQVAMRVKDYPNVIGYDIMNEPVGMYFMFSLYAFFASEVHSTKSEVLPDETVDRLINEFMDSLLQRGATPETVDTLYKVINDYDLLPRSREQLQQTGFLPMTEGSVQVPDFDAAFDMNLSFNHKYLQPMHEKVGQAIQEEDPDGVIFVELSMGLPDSGIGGWFAEPMLRPEGIDQVAFAPHYYSDIYPMIGYDIPERDFTVDEIRFRDYTDGILGAIDATSFSLGKPPTIIGEFGTYFNFGGIEKSIENGYEVSAHMLDNHFEAYEQMLLGHTMWCYSPENTKENGENWNAEDFSILDSEQKPRAVGAYSRIYPRFTSGRLISFNYNSPYHYYDPRPGEPTPYLEFNMEMESKETDAPTEIFVPSLIFTEGFYVYISDGRIAWDNQNSILYWYPSKDNPEAIHTIRIRPPYDDFGDSGWDYCIENDRVMEGRS